MAVIRDPLAVDLPPQGTEYVRWVQSSLNAILDLRLPVDGVMGPETRSAVRSFQGRQGLPPDGVVGPDTERALIAARAEQSPGSTAAADEEWSDELEGGGFELVGLEPEGEVNRNSRDYIRWVQQSLNRILGLRLAVDGIVGTQTRSAIRSFQQRQGLTVDGIVGPQTEGALIRAGAGSPPGASATVTPGRPIDMPPLTIRVQPFVVLDRFDLNRATLPSRYQPIITRTAHLVVASQALAEPLQTIRLVGHTDSSGSQSYNTQLGQQRAQEVQRALTREIERLRPGLSARLTIVAQSLGETRPAASNSTSQGRATNRRVEVFLPTTCQTFFAQYDLRFLPGHPILGIPAYPNLSDSEKSTRASDVGTVAEELVRRRDQRARDALAGRVSAANPVPFSAAQNSLHSRARRLSTAQIALFREYCPDGSGSIDFTVFQEWFERFANGEIRSPHPEFPDDGVGEPEGGFYFLFAEFAFLCIDSGIDTAIWTQALKAFVKTQEIFMHVYRPNPVSSPPPVGAPLPPRRSPPLALDAYEFRNFTRTGPAGNVGRGQSNQTRKRALRTRYDRMDLAALRRAAMDNMLRAQHMP